MTVTAPTSHAARVLPALKDFQRTSVDYAFRRMYEDPDCTTRFLIADEVGLGKTMVARGIIARVLDRLQGQVERIDIVYVCSNSAIARQNIRKLAIRGAAEAVRSERITMLPVEARNLRGNRVNLISFTPATSFDLQSSLGQSRERVLLYHLVEQAWGLKGPDARDLLRGKVQRGRFRERVDGFDEGRIDQELADDFVSALRAESGLEAEFRVLTERFRGVKSHRKVEPEFKKRQRELIGNLRHVLARACLRALEPDLIILDEFQRFKHLLGGDDEESVLARELFDYTDAASNRARVLLLSATPYKMYTESDDAGGEDHYQDFLATVRFLQQDEARTSRTAALLEEYRKEWLRRDDGFERRLQELKRAIEAELRRVMIRTERLAVTPDRDGMLWSVPIPDLELHPREALTYRQIGKIAEAVEHADPVEYWKSAPYLLSFMEEYHLKRLVEEALCGPECRQDISELVDRRLPLLLPWGDIERYAHLDPANARMRWLMGKVIDSGAWRILWVPPSRPWYRLGEPFNDPALAEFTKLLVFSGWKVVPKAIAALVSYEAERRMMELGGNTDNTPEARRRFSLPLRIDQESVYTLTYPSFTLARLAAEAAGDPALRERTPDEVLELVTSRVEKLLAALPAGASVGAPDPTWYWVAPALLDWKADRAATRAWFSQPELVLEWMRVTADEDEDVHVAGMRIQKLHDLVRTGGETLGARPADLSRILALIALASPATASLRALAAVLGGKDSLKNLTVRNAAGRVGWAFRGYANLQEVGHLLRGLDPDQHYWQRVLRYNLNGCLGAVLGEYVHVLYEWLSLTDDSVEDAADQMALEAEKALGIRTASISADAFVPGDDGVLVREQRRLRSRFAARLADERAEDGSEGTRIEVVRTAFNSPFWPFVLATTSIGQEGLDFHLYCHAVAHWNLPSNPVDLEQREGRVHRYKGHAVRKNVALRHADEVTGGGLSDVWAAMFRAAELLRPTDGNEIWPFWVYPVDGGAKIERHVPALPLSRDTARLDRVRRMATLYRMVFGQVRQEDLIAALERLPAEGVDQSLLINLHPETNGQ